ncbi:MAG: peptidoglycan bridge formation glycyltransferase FemA/FemB family protein [Streptococcus salivarius]
MSINLDQFYDILVRTAERKGFSVHPLAYFQDLKECFGRICQSLCWLIWIVQHLSGLS